MFFNFAHKHPGCFDNLIAPSWGFTSFFESETTHPLVFKSQEK
jgi:hypothetical protein